MVAPSRLLSADPTVRRESIGLLELESQPKSSAFACLGGQLKKTGRLLAQWKFPENVDDDFAAFGIGHLCKYLSAFNKPEVSI